LNLEHAPCRTASCHAEIEAVAGWLGVSLGWLAGRSDMISMVKLAAAGFKKKPGLES
jgi:hypothetical protein